MHNHRSWSSARNRSRFDRAALEHPTANIESPGESDVAQSKTHHFLIMSVPKMQPSNSPSRGMRSRNPHNDENHDKTIIHFKFEPEPSEGRTPRVTGYARQDSQFQNRPTRVRRCMRSFAIGRQGQGRYDSWPQYSKHRVTRI